MDLRNLQTFMAIVESGSFSAASKRLNYTQSTITFQVNQLEQELSVKLFERIGRRMVITDAGRKLIPYVQQVMSSVDKLRCFDDDISQCRGDLHVGAAETLLCYKMPDILKRFTSAAPRARLFISSMNCYDIRDSLISGKLDIGVFYSDVGGYGTALNTMSVGTFPVTLVASAKTAEKFSDFDTPDRDIELPLIINEPKCIFRQMFEGYLTNRDIRLDHTIEIGSIPTIINMVKSDVGISFLPCFTVEHELEAGQLREIHLPISQNQITAVCAHHKNKWISPLMRLFMDICAENKE